MIGYLIASGPNNFARIDLSDCKISRYLKYLIFEFAVSLRKRESEVYEGYLSEDRLL